MPKKWKGRLEDIADLENARAAYRLARTSTANKQEKGCIYYSTDEHLEEICRSLLAETYHPEPAHTFHIVEPVHNKIRFIEAPTFQTKLVEQMILCVYGEAICRYLHPFQCGSVPGKGQEYSRKLVKRFSRLPDKQRRYVVQGDVRHFFPTIERDVAMRAYAEHIGDERVLRLIYSLMPHEVGQPLGNALVQASANLVLAPFAYETAKWSSHFVVQMDDFVVIFSSKRKARRYIRHIVPWMRETLHLEIKESGPGAIQFYDWKKRAVDISGYVTSWNGSQRVRKHTYQALEKMMKLPSFSRHQACSFVSRLGLVRHSSSVRLYDRLVKCEREHGLRRIISKEDMKRNEDLKKRNGADGTDRPHYRRRQKILSCRSFQELEGCRQQGAGRQHEDFI